MKKAAKKMAALLLAGVMAASLAGCGAKADTKENSPANEESYKIGVIQLMEHDALDASYQGFVDGLKEAGYVDGENITIDFQNAQGEVANCDNIATKLVNDKNDLILAIATPAAQAVAGKTTEIPLLITAVTDPATSGLVESNEKPGTNVTGTSDLTPVAQQIELLIRLFPEAKTVGVLYNSSETNSQFQAAIAKEELEKAGLAYVDSTVSSSNEIQSVTQSLIGKVDVIYSPTDNMIATGMAAVASVATENHIPCVVGEEGMVRNGGLITYGINYYNLGKQTAAMAVRILKGEGKPADMPIEYLEDVVYTVNKTAAEELQVEIPKDILDVANIVE